MSNKPRIQVYILTGFLGSGKTTILNHLLSSLKGSRVTVIENEFGDISIDGSLINQQLSQVVELSNGCICCSLDEDLYDVLTELAQSELPSENLFIETTGIADPGNVASIFKREDVSKVFELKRVLCVIDAETVEDYLKQTSELHRQIIGSDVLIINKIGLVDPTYLSSLQKILNSMNPFADFVTTEDGQFNFELLEKSQTRIVIPKPKWSLLGRFSHQISTTSFSTLLAFDERELLHALTVTLMLYYKQVYRIKGFVQVKGRSEKFLLQSTGQRLTLEAIGSWDSDQRLSQMVFIGIGLQHQTIERILRPTFANGLTKTDVKLENE
ncbi:MULTISPECIES: GTP-binding protein [unclassified Siphonobacter]|uniref:CobW family GTP-binding protein n=1 Tax=unclassified Siphonobacter TaxID=2635712 RepID=UPI0018E3C8FA|nr:MULTISPECIES: GTP-binding protein [unclassified Siphonobacter]